MNRRMNLFLVMLATIATIGAMDQRIPNDGSNKPAPFVSQPMHYPGQMASMQQPCQRPCCRLSQQAYPMHQPMPTPMMPFSMMPTPWIPNPAYFSQMQMYMQCMQPLYAMINNIQRSPASYSSYMSTYQSSIEPSPAQFAHTLNTGAQHRTPVQRESADSEVEDEMLEVAKDLMSFRTSPERHQNEKNRSVLSRSRAITVKRNQFTQKEKKQKAKAFKNISKQHIKVQLLSYIHNHELKDLLATRR